ncbi:hypothetical protein TRFO_27688 [Tritrichomonas foetus]|uniref:Uncharacterized protein n=1 Tax=Tritrichomonas foetus TaxID=1144522 RepID=A0A1J4K0D2_9EUKA|nr:hypothetical protein TRFO_27688 [Tritrichomonas foetus]|eukprot:OHT04691.1 hypothetical protein TRFO_27688 [Tritrichomonas foetus]
MHIAAFADALECFVTLEKNKQSIKTQSADGLLPIHYAIGGGALEVVSYILSKDQTYYENLNAPNVSFIF